MAMVASQPAAKISEKMAASEVDKHVAKLAGSEWKPKTERVPQEYIDHILAHPQKPLRPLPPSVFDSTTKRGAVFIDAFASLQARLDKDQDILHQYRLKGYAEVEITDDEEDEEITDDEVDEEI